MPLDGNQDNAAILNEILARFISAYSVIKNLLNLDKDRSDKIIQNRHAANKLYHAIKGTGANSDESILLSFQRLDINTASVEEIKSLLRKSLVNLVTKFKDTMALYPIIKEMRAFIKQNGLNTNYSYKLRGCQVETTLVDRLDEYLLAQDKDLGTEDSEKLEREIAEVDRQFKQKFNVLLIRDQENSGKLKDYQPSDASSVVSSEPSMSEMSEDVGLDAVEAERLRQARVDAYKPEAATPTFSAVRRVTAPGLVITPPPVKPPERIADGENKERERQQIEWVKREKERAAAKLKQELATKTSDLQSRLVAWLQNIAIIITNNLSFYAEYYRTKSGTFMADAKCNEAVNTLANYLMAVAKDFKEVNYADNITKLYQDIFSWLAAREFKNIAFYGKHKVDLHTPNCELYRILQIFFYKKITSYYDANLKKTNFDNLVAVINNGSVFNRLEVLEEQSKNGLYANSCYAMGDAMSSYSTRNAANLTLPHPAYGKQITAYHYPFYVDLAKRLQLIDGYHPEAELYDAEEAVLVARFKEAVAYRFSYMAKVLNNNKKHFVVCYEGNNKARNLLALIELLNNWSTELYALRTTNLGIKDVYEMVVSKFNGGLCVANNLTNMIMLFVLGYLETFYQHKLRFNLNIEQKVEVTINNLRVMFAANGRDVFSSTATIVSSWVEEGILFDRAELLQALDECFTRNGCSYFHTSQRAVYAEYCKLALDYYGPFYYRVAEQIAAANSSFAAGERRAVADLSLNPLLSPTVKRPSINDGEIHSEMSAGKFGGSSAAGSRVGLVTGKPVARNSFFNRLFCGIGCCKHDEAQADDGEVYQY